jgi:hypothetical protein
MVVLQRQSPKPKLEPWGNEILIRKFSPQAEGFGTVLLHGLHATNGPELPVTAGECARAFGALVGTKFIGQIGRHFFAIARLKQEPLLRRQVEHGYLHSRRRVLSGICYPQHENRPV